MGAKTFPLVNLWGYQLNASVAIFLIPIVYSVNDVIVEVFGKERMRKLIKMSLVIIVLIILTSLFFTWLPPSTRSAGMESAYDTIFGVSIRMSIASLLAFACADFLDVYIFAALRKKL
jgi:queuosine precursor transporter